MDAEDVRNYCLSKKGVTESFPFDNETLVFKVIGKMFCLVSLKYPVTLNLKCKPEQATELRERFPEIKPGYHMNKKHWNTVETEGNLSDEFIFEMIDISYKLVVEKLSPKEKKQLK